MTESRSERNISHTFNDLDHSFIVYLMAYHTTANQANTPSSQTHKQQVITLFFASSQHFSPRNAIIRQSDNIYNVECSTPCTPTQQSVNRNTSQEGSKQSTSEAQTESRLEHTSGTAGSGRCGAGRGTLST